MFGKSMGIAALFVASLAGTACTNRSGLNFSGGSGGAGAGANGGQAGGADSGVASGGTVGMGGAVGAGRTVGTGGAIGSGGAVGSGGVSIGGAVGSGGAVALGGTLVVDIPSQVPEAMNHRQMDKKSEVVHEARLTGDSLLAKITGKQRLGVNSTHHQAIGRVAQPLRVTATSEDGVVEATELKGEAAHLSPWFLTVQFHPERLARRYPEHQALFNSFTRACVLNRNSNL